MRRIARRRASRRRLPTSKGPRRARWHPAETERSLLRRHSLGVDGFLRVCRARLAARWFAAPAPTFSPLGAGPCRFRRTRWLVANASSRVSPHKLHLSLRAPGLPPALPPSRPKGGSTVRRVPLLRFIAPPALKVQSVHHSQPYLSCFVPPSPFLTTSAACSALHRPGISPGGTHGIPRPSGLLPPRVGHPRYRLRHPLLTLPPPLRAFAGSSRRNDLHVQPRCVFRVFPALRPYPPTSGFPSAGDRPPRGLLL